VRIEGCQHPIERGFGRRNRGDRLLFALGLFNAGNGGGEQIGLIDLMDILAPDTQECVAEMLELLIARPVVRRRRYEDLSETIVVRRTKPVPN
jgi:hypothetical protein